MYNRILHPGRRVKLAFTVLEVLIAMGIFAVGFAAVAAIFPTAILLQKQTVDDVLGQQVARNAQALLEARGLSLINLNTEGLGTTTWSQTQRVYPLPSTMLDPGGAWTPSDRSYPSTAMPLESRKMFWVPLVRNRVPVTSSADIDPAEVVVYVFVLQREQGVTYAQPSLTMANPNDPDEIPRVARLSGVTVGAADRFDLGSNANLHNGNLMINAGDEILDCYGGIYKVTLATPSSITVSNPILPNVDTGSNPDEIWFAVSDEQGRVRPTRRILTLTSAVKP